MNIGFIGMGVMGAPMAGHLADAGHNIFTCLNRSPLPQTLSGKSVEVVNTPAEVAAHCDTVIIMVPDTPDVERVITGENGVLINVHKGSLIIDMSSISPIATAALARAVNEQDSLYVDAPVSGGEVGAKAASLTIMCGGPQEAFDRAKPLFELMGKNITLIGEHNGAGQTCKIANQIIVALNIEAVAEALVFASKAGCDPATVREALMGGFASSKILEVHGERMIKRTMDPGFRIELHQKDLNLALASARALGVSLPNTATAQELFNSCSANGGAQDDHSGMVKALERLANHPVAS
ncbi:2-hydroxy-3-oxopropionate reductase [Ruegeria denitrificans]|uniref:2-hydroxy-3-oxopropionate reductase n=1 Tax=Ruegeria denitrificans TaxID=1715692 RepID=A0A0P1IK16_9RHOB|nr:2-hydroxy-3-oxopropionate reductase [Ruegeria denitrificans]CUK18643.1 2-hydroxy-3-oxopropionate reductase [Ruegeria denitrificans]